MGTFSCPVCGKEKQMDLSPFMHGVKEIRLKYTCPCKHQFSVVVERRRHIRKKVSLNGRITRNHTKFPIKVVDVSRQGLKIKTMNSLEFQMGEKVVVEFTLDDTHQSTVAKNMIVRTKTIGGFGLQFESFDHYDKYGAYILFHFN